MNISIEWDEDNAAAHFKKHKISFEIAARVFADPFALMAQDRIENGEQRWQTIGMVDGHLVLLVAHTVKLEPELNTNLSDHTSNDGAKPRQHTEVIRIISARKADKQERKRYENSHR
jgi:uncharacterized protein